MSQIAPKSLKKKVGLDVQISKELRHWNPIHTKLGNNIPLIQRQPAEKS